MRAPSPILLPRPPRLPPEPARAPGSPAEVQRARRGVEERGRQLLGGLRALAALTLLSGLLGAAALIWGLSRWPEWLASFTESAGETLADLSPPAWTLLVLPALALLGTALQVWATLIARRAVGTLGRWTLAPDPALTSTFQRQWRAVRPWLSLGQWGPVVIAALGWVPAVWLAGLGAGEVEAGELGLGLGAALLGSLAQQLPGLVINALIFAALRRWVDALLTRSVDPRFPVWPFVRPLDGWLLLTTVLCALGAVSGLLTGLGLLAFGGLWPTLLQAAEAGGEWSAQELGEVSRVFGTVFPSLGGLLVLSGAFYGLLAALMAWSRGLALDSATVLDAGLDAGGKPRDSASPLHPVPLYPAPEDAWNGPEEIVPPRDPRSGR